MKQTKKWICAIAIISFITIGASAQTIETAPTYSDAPGGTGKVKLNLLYNYSMPVGSFKNDFIKENSPRGFNADILYWMNPKWGIGGAFGFQDFYYKNERQNYKLSDGSDISAVLTHSLQTVPVMVKAMYAPTAGSGLIQPYVSAAAGVNVIHFSEYVGEFNSLDNSSVGFTAEAGAGLKIPFGQHERAGFLLGASYRFSPYNKYEIKNLNTVNLHAGLQFRISK